VRWRLQDEQDFLDSILVAGGRLLVVGGHSPEAALLQDLDRARVVHLDIGIEGSRRHVAEQEGESFRRDAAAPVVTADPVADELSARLLPAQHVPDDAAVRHDRLRHARRVCSDLGPMSGEVSPVPRWEGGHPERLGVLLVGEERLEVAVLDVPDLHVKS
jgi:hypothetical protein